MKVAVITPYHREPVETLKRCHESVRAQTHPCTHFMVADGHAAPPVADWDVQHIVLPKSHGDYGNTPRCLGAVSALNQGFEAFAFLDADNWYAADHVESLVDACAQTRAAAAFASRHVVLPDGQAVEVGGDGALAGHVDTNCMFLTTSAAFLLPIWAMMDPSLAVIGDRIVLRALQQRGLPAVETGRRTVFYESRWATHYELAGQAVPPDAKITIGKVGEGFSAERSLSRLGFDIGVRIGG